MKYLIIAVMLFLAGCQKPASESKSSGNFNVETLFTHDGCTVYRFQDDRTVYFTNCTGATQYQENCGKNCSRTVGVN